MLSTHHSCLHQTFHLLCMFLYVLSLTLCSNSSLFKASPANHVDAIHVQSSSVLFTYSFAHTVLNIFVFCFLVDVVVLHTPYDPHESVSNWNQWKVLQWGWHMWVMIRQHRLTVLCCTWVQYYDFIVSHICLATSSTPLTSASSLIASNHPLSPLHLNPHVHFFTHIQP